MLQGRVSRRRSERDIYETAARGIESDAAADLNVLHPHRERLDLVVEMLSNCEFRLRRELP